MDGMMPDAPRIELSKLRHSTYYTVYPFADNVFTRIEAVHNLKLRGGEESRTVHWPSIGSVSPAEARAFARAILAAADAVEGEGI